MAATYQFMVFTFVLLVWAKESFAAPLAATPPVIDSEWWGVVTQEIAELNEQGNITTFASTFTQAISYERGWFMQAAQQSLSSPKNDSGPTYVMANDLTNRERGSYTFAKELMVCLIKDTDLVVVHTLEGVPDYAASKLIATNVTIEGVGGLEQWNTPDGGAGLDKSFFVLPTGTGQGRLIQQQWRSVSYNETIRYLYWWTSAPIPLFKAKFAEWQHWNSSLIGCIDRRPKPLSPPATPPMIPAALLLADERAGDLGNCSSHKDCCTNPLKFLCDKHQQCECDEDGGACFSKVCGSSGCCRQQFRSL